MVKSDEILSCQYPKRAYDYARHVLKSRWLEAEPFIMEEPEAAYHYAAKVINGRWIEAEPYILQDPCIAVYYAMDVIQGRWLELEDLLIKDSINNSFWCKNYLKWNVNLRSLVEN